MQKKKTNKKKKAEILAYVNSVVGGAENELRSAVVSGANIGNVKLAAYKLLGTTKVAELQSGRFRVEQKILWFYVTVTNSLRVYVGETAKQLIHKQLKEIKREGDGRSFFE